MTIFTIPLQNVPQTFDITLGEKEYAMTCRWNDAVDAGWVLDFSDAETALPIVSNIPLICGANLLAGLEYLGFDGKFVVYTDGKEFDPPTLLNLGVESNLYFLTDVVTDG